MKSIFLLSLFVLLAHTVASASKKCYALAIEGSFYKLYPFLGGNVKNAYTVGVLRSIVKLLSPEERSYDVISGTSMGSLAALVLGLTPRGEEEQAVDYLSNFWKDLDDNKIFKLWPLGLVDGFFFRSGLMDSTPLLQTIWKIGLDLRGSDFYRKLAIGVSDINSGELLTVHETVGLDRLLDYVKAATTVPGLFPPVPENSSLLVSGSAIMSLDIAAAIEGCREVVDKDEDIVLDVIMIQEVTNMTKDCSAISGLSMIFRYFEIYGHTASLHQLENMENEYPNVQKRFLFYPQKSLPSDFGVKGVYTHDKIEKMLKMGESDGAHVINTRKYSWDVKEVVEMMHKGKPLKEEGIEMVTEAY